ncbi:hypothetical protein [Streptomyces sp. NPDC001568]|uniref:hypothetical protein n=1 Tax=Streptomyces sp. NPDC001568 TaxID=3364588 RepID=UPI0036B5266B
MNEPTLTAAPPSQRPAQCSHRLRRCVRVRDLGLAVRRREDQILGDSANRPRNADKANNKKLWG